MIDRLTRRFSFRHRHSWEPVPLQSNSCISVPLVIAPPVTSMHLPSARSIPLPLFQVQLCAPLWFQVSIWFSLDKKHGTPKLDVGSVSRTKGALS